MADQDMKSLAPMSAAYQASMRMTQEKPTIATRLKIIKDRLMPILSDR